MQQSRSTSRPATHCPASAQRVHAGPCAPAVAAAAPRGRWRCAAPSRRRCARATARIPGRRCPARRRCWLHRRPAALAPTPARPGSAGTRRGGLRHARGPRHRGSRRHTTAAAPAPSDARRCREGPRARSQPILQLGRASKVFSLPPRVEHACLHGVDRTADDLADLAIADAVEVGQVRRPHAARARGDPSPAPAPRASATAPRGAPDRPPAARADRRRVRLAPARRSGSAPSCALR